MNAEHQLVKILFVDDEPRVLQGIKRMLRTMRKQWQLHFCTSADDALKAMSEEHFTVVVADMRMPITDGAALLTKVAEEHPDCIRIILSGQSSRESILKVVNVAHQFLAKPCESTRLIDTLNLSLQYSELIQNSGLHNVLSGIGEIPSIPHVYQQLVDLTQQEDFGMQEASKLIAQDPAMSAKILKLVNSAFFGLPRQITNPQEAALMLGAERLTSLVLLTELFSTMSEQQIRVLQLDSLLDKSISRMSMAKQIAATEQLEPTQQSLLESCCLLGDIGLLSLATSLPEVYTQVNKIREQEHVSTLEAEQQVLHTTHIHMTAYLLGVWGLPLAMTELLLAQLTPPSDPGNKSDLANILRACRLLTNFDEIDAANEAFIKAGYPQSWLEIGQKEILCD